MLAPWVMDEMKTAELSDKRLNERLTIVLSQLASYPNLSIPAACGGFAEMTAAYRLFDNDRVSFANVLEPHLDATRGRIASQPIVLFVQDTTEIDLTHPQMEVQGAGPLDGDSRRGALLHLMHAFTPDGTPLGTIDAHPWVRDDDAPRLASQTRAQRAQTPIEEKESYRWVLALRRAQEEASRLENTRVVCVADSEADIYELLAESADEPPSVDWIVRAAQDRALQEPVLDEDSQALLRAQLIAQPVLFTQPISVRGRKAKTSCEKRGRRQPRESRKTEVVVRAGRVTLRPPWRADRKLPPISINVVLVSEVNPPANDEPVEWILLTSLPIDDLEQVRLVVQYYCTRWMVEVFFRTLKTGCRVERRRFEHIDRLLTCLAVYLIVTWRTLYTCRMGRSCPDVSCEVIFEPAEWKAVYRVVRRQKPPKKPPKLAEMVRMVAILGGYVDRRRDDPPGPQTVWTGLQRAHDMALCWQLFGPEARGSG